MYIIIINFEEDINRLFIMISGIGIGFELSGIGIGIEMSGIGIGIETSCE